MAGRHTDVGGRGARLEGDGSGDAARSHGSGLEAPEGSRAKPAGSVGRTVSWWLAEAADTLLTLVVRAMSMGVAEADEGVTMTLVMGVAFEGFS